LYDAVFGAVVFVIVDIVEGPLVISDSMMAVRKLFVTVVEVVIASVFFVLLTHHDRWWYVSELLLLCSVLQLLLMRCEDRWW